VSKPRVFIGSSSSKLNIAYAIQRNLEEYELSPTVWTQAAFKLSDTNIEALIDRLSKSDFAIFVFSPEDMSKIKGENVSTVRDNVIFELGLFIGALGRKSCFMISPRNAIDLHLPTDLLGISLGQYDDSRPDDELQASLGPACSLINDQITDIVVNTSEGVEVIEETDPCRADWKIAERKSRKEGVDFKSSDTSDLFFVLLSVVNCQSSRIIADDLQAAKFPNVRIEAMYDLMGSWDLLIKFRANGDENEFENALVRKLVKEGQMEESSDGPFVRRKLVNVISQSLDIDGLLNKEDDQTLHYTLLSSSDDYDKFRASRAFLFLEAKGKPGSKQRKKYLRHLSGAINGKFGSSIIESICEGESELIIETFSSCAQSNYINHLNKAVEPVLTTHHLQKYTLTCYHYDEEGLLNIPKESLGGQ